MQEKIFKRLRDLYIKDYKGFFIDNYEGQNRLARKATLYAVRNTAHVWREETKDG